LLAAALLSLASGAPGAQGSTSAFFPSVAGREGEVLTVQNWSAAVDYFVVQNKPLSQGVAPINQVDFTGSPVDSWTREDIRWVTVVDGSFGQLTPVPEPSTYGAILLGSAAALVAYRRRRATKQAAA